MSSVSQAIISHPAGHVTVEARTILRSPDSRPDLDPVRRLLAALADSLAATYRRLASEAGIALGNIDVRTEAGLDFDLVSPGHLRIEVRLGGDADIAALEALRLAAETQDPLIRLVRQPIPTRLEIALDLRDTRGIAA